MTIICLETDDEEFYSYELSRLIEGAISSQDQEDINYIRWLWNNESWEGIQRKFNTEGSVWYVWWMDGVREYMHLNLIE